MKPVASLIEIAAILKAHGALACIPTSTCDDGKVILTIELAGDGLEQLAIADEIKHVINVANLRAIAETYLIDETELERFIGRIPDLPIDRAEEFLDAVRRLMKDDDGSYKEIKSCADVVETISQLLEQAETAEP